MQVLLRTASEINLKSQHVRRRFLDRLMRNMRDSVQRKGYKAEIRNHWSRLFVEIPNMEAAEALSNVFGVHSFCAVEHTCAPTIEAMSAVALEHYQEKVRAKSFAIRAHRGDVGGFNSQEVARTLGAVLYPFARKVDLTTPEVEIFVDIRSEGAFFFSEYKAGPNGLPVGVQGKALCLISGGFDSAVAAWLLLKRGVALDFLFCNLAGMAYQRAVMAVTKTLCDRWALGYQPQFYSVDFTEIVKSIKAQTSPKYNQVMLKRAMYKVANLVARKAKAKALVTGESVGQVSSQTLFNLAAIDEASSLAVFRPLIGFDKEEIIALSKKIGTHTLSKSMIEYCQISTHSPVTRGYVHETKIEDEKLDEAMYAKAVASREKFNLSKLSTESLTCDDLFIKEIPSQSEVIDCRTEQDFAQWHYPNAKLVEMEALLANFANFDKNRAYVLYCPFGMQSAVAAERMQKAGYEAYSFFGGSQALRTYSSQVRA